MMAAASWPASPVEEGIRFTVSGFRAAHRNSAVHDGYGFAIRTIMINQCLSSRMPGKRAG